MQTQKRGGIGLGTHLENVYYDMHGSSFNPCNAAQKRHNVGFVLVDGPFEGGLAIAAGRRVGRKRDNTTTQHQKRVSNKNAHVVFAFTSALAAISSWHTLTVLT